MALSSVLVYRSIWNHGSSGTLSAGAVALYLCGFVRDKPLHVVPNLLEFVSHDSLPVLSFPLCGPRVWSSSALLVLRGICSKISTEVGLCAVFRDVPHVSV